MSIGQQIEKIQAEIVTEKDLIDQIDAALIEKIGSDVEFKWGGLNPTLIGEYAATWNISDTSFEPGVSQSTSSTSIKATTANVFVTASTAIGDKDIVVIQRGQAIPQYGDGAVANNKQEKYGILNITYFSKRKANKAATTETYRQNYAISCVLLQYTNNSGTSTRTAASYGFYMSPASPSVASTTSNTTTVRCGTPTLYYRVSSSYCSATNILAVTDVDYRWNVKAYLVDPHSTLCSEINRELDYILTNDI